ncbi:MAG: EscR/YscR/HrcR family type III secretion system export apparatus protein [Pseudomonadota bacterium]
MEEFSSPLLLGFVASLALVAMLTLTSFVKLSIVFMIVRQALGLQQVPSNIILLALALFLSIFISMPVFNAAVIGISESGVTLDGPADLIRMYRAGIAPFQAFLTQNIDPEHSEFLVQVSAEVWRGSGMVGSPDDLVIQIPAFMVSEMTEAFRIAFLLYLPFIAVDLAVTGILMALGMQMVQPNIIAVPFKLLVFLAVDGWGRMVEGLVMGYAV